ncbi:putative cyclin-D6-1 [Cajanus cajan]|uniref:B-like cyclin n=1 Tax=Cajanus cajan TaxID=3821 RepID=A0A151TP08_CAJCA|nr:putative cyclin-D6-1 [Cajanus cajan]KYP68805.1 Putative cyclin-D6-1 [Cajanus cajan]
MEFDLENPLENLHPDALSYLFLIESDHTPSQNHSHTLRDRDLDISVRTELISLISQLSCTLDPVLCYLAINYLDRFLANQGILQTKPWALRLIAVSCISLAVKMMRTEYPTTDVQTLLNQSDGGIIFEAQTIQRMETLILGALKWRMRSITPFSFVAFFIALIEIKDSPMGQVLKNRASEIIFKSQREIRLWEFKPSIIAASALLCASHELFPFQYPSILKAISDSSYVNKENVEQCYKVIQDIAIEEEYESALNGVSRSETPINVLDHHFLSSESEKTNGIIVADSPLRQEGDLKRRKITGCGNNPTIHNSWTKPCSRATERE